MAVKLDKKQKALIEEEHFDYSGKKALEVKNLVISFKTDNGKVQAVRGVSFDLYEGETLCIVGESGSGKSVTSKAIMGILSGNALVEGGQIIYNGEDLLKVAEEEFHRIRGHKIGMIFQDPLSSLNPIVRIGKQIIETMLINKNQLKNHFDDLVADELTAYKNEAVIRDVAISEGIIAYENMAHDFKKEEEELNEQILDLKKQIKEEIKIKGEASAELSTKLDELNNKLASTKLSHEAALKEQAAKKDQIRKEAKAHYREVAPALKAAYKARKKVAKVETKEYAIALKQKHDEDIAALQEEKANLPLSEEDYAKIAEYDNQLKDLRKKLNLQLALHYLDPGKKQKIREAFDGEAMEIKKQRAVIAQPLDDINAKIASVDEEYNFSIKITRSMAKKKALRVMSEVGIPFADKRFKQYPFQFSGGMRQRIVIAIALIADPDILICDEPTTALDVTIQAQILELINDLKAKHNMSVIFITHDLGVVANMADRVAVMYAGKIVEYGSDREVFFDPRHPYTWALLSSIPDIDSKERLEAIPGTPPDMIYPPIGDAFAIRNKYALAIDFKYEPPLFQVSPTHFASTWLEYDGAPEVEPPAIVKTRIYNALSDEEERKKHE